MFGIRPTKDQAAALTRTVRCSNTSSGSDRKRKLLLSPSTVGAFSEIMTTSAKRSPVPILLLANLKSESCEHSTDHKLFVATRGQQNKLQTTQSCISHSATLPLVCRIEVITPNDHNHRVH